MKLNQMSQSPFCIDQSKAAFLFILLFFGSTFPIMAQSNQFVLFDVAFNYTKEQADHSSPSKSHFYVKDALINPNRPLNWLQPIDYRHGTVHVRIEVLEKPPGEAPTVWSLCYIPNRGQGNGYGCTNTPMYTQEGVFEKDVLMTNFWENEAIVWEEGIKQMDLVIKDNSGGQGHAHKRTDHERYFPTRVRISMIQVPVGEVYKPEMLTDKPLNVLY